MRGIEVCYPSASKKSEIYKQDFGCEIHSQQNIYLPGRENIKCKYVSSPRGKSHPVEREV